MFRFTPLSPGVWLMRRLRLPIIAVDGHIVSTGIYLTRAQLAAKLGLGTAKPKITAKAGGSCCSGSSCC